MKMNVLLAKALHNFSNVQVYGEYYVTEVVTISFEQESRGVYSLDGKYLCRMKKSSFEILDREVKTIEVDVGCN